jgi:trimeric autotransporter adhesin
MKKLYCLFIFFFIGSQITILRAQVAISTTAAIPDPSAMLDIKSNTKGILVPRTSTSSRTAIINPAKGLMVYDTVTGSFWFHNGSAWTEVSNANTVWNMQGNTNTDPAVNFIGTTDAIPLNIRVNNQPAGRIDPDLFNTSWGFQALAVTTGSQNTATGYQSLYSNTSGVRNTAYGCYSLSVNSTGNSNTAGGYQSMYVNTSGSANTAYGSNTLFHNTTGAENSAGGYQALFFNTTGFNNSAFGYQALFNNSTGYYNTAAGDYALADNTTGINNTATGSSSLGNNSTGHDNTAGGNEALAINSIGNYNTSMGSASLFSNTSGGFNTALGDATLYNNTTGSKLQQLPGIGWNHCRWFTNKSRYQQQQPRCRPAYHTAI